MCLGCTGQLSGTRFPREKGPFNAGNFERPATQVETQRSSSFLVASLTRFFQHSGKSADYLGLLPTCLSRSFSSPVLLSWPLPASPLRGLSRSSRISPSPLLSTA